VSPFVFRIGIHPFGYAQGRLFRVSKIKKQLFGKLKPNRGK